VRPFLGTRGKGEEAGEALHFVSFVEGSSFSSFI
jgi:hypothetical protein